MKKVYVVTEGVYAAYHIVAVFSTKEKAEEYIAYHGTECRLEEYDLDVDFEHSESLWSVNIDMASRYETWATNMKLRKYPDYEMYANTCRLTFYDTDLINFVVFADTSEGAIKVAREHLETIKANDKIWQRLQPTMDGKLPTYNFKTGQFVDLWALR